MPINTEAFSLLTQEDPSPFTVVNGKGKSSVLLVCEHAGQAIPSRLGDLGLSQDAINDHIGWDIGAAEVTRRMADRLDAVAILQPYSRLVIDCNRPPHAPDSIPQVSDGTHVPGNMEIAQHERRARTEEIFRPFHAEVDRYLQTDRFSAAISIHSFTPRMNNVSRQWDIGFLYRFDTLTSEFLRESLASRYPELVIGMNEPYQISDLTDWFVPQHAERRDIPHSLIEIRNDHIRTPADQAHWAAILSQSVADFLNRK